MTRIVIESQNKLDLPAEELQSLAADLRAYDPVGEVTIDEREIKGYGVTWWEVVRIWLVDPVVSGAAAGTAAYALNAGRNWACERFVKVPKRPKYIGIYGPDGNVLKSILIKDEMMEEEDRTDADRVTSLRPRPPM
jgi:hypothetical protein